MKKTISILVIGLILNGCATSNTSYNAPDGTTYRKVKCNVDTSECFQDASKSCPNGQYRVISSESHAGGIAADIFPGPVTWYSMTYMCEKSDGKMPTFPFTGPTYTPPVNVNVRHSGSIYHY